VPARLLERVRSAFWFVPATCVVAAAGLALALVQLDEKLKRDGGGVAFAGGPESARSLLSAIASSMLTLTALVFSITVVVLQLTSSQFSPRVLRTFLRDRQNQLTLGVFTATFVYALMALREVRGQDGLVDLFVPGITISVAFGLVLVSVALFVAYIHHIVNSIRVVTIIDRIRIETESTIDRLAERGAEAAPLPPAPDGPVRDIAAARSGAVVAVDVDRLVRLAAEAHIVLRVVPQIGEFVPEGSPLLQAPVGANVDDAALGRAVQLDIERDTSQDMAFGLRQLVDIAERALTRAFQ
jgi:uncharacterized membrane protein